MSLKIPLNMNASVEETLARLVDIDSVSSLSNREIIAYTSARAEAAGMRVQLFPYTDERGTEKVNMVALAPGTASLKSEIELTLVGHTDTVPYDPAWREATTLVERDGKLYGRGSCDTKGFIAAALTAIEGMNIAGLRRPLALVCTADEEVGCLGAKRLAEAGIFRTRYGIVGEPTSLQPMRAGKGYCLAEVIVRGREAHSAHPELGQSAVFHAARLITRIEAVAERLQAEQHPEFDPPYTTLNVGLISGGTAKNITPRECRFTLEWRPVPGRAPEHVLELVEKEIEGLQASDAEFDCRIERERIDNAMETRADSPLVVALEAATNRTAGTVSFGTEAPQMVQLGAEAVILGPGDIRVAHRTGEFVPTAELRDCVRIISRMIERFCM